MGTIADKLNYLEETKQSIRAAIENKGVTISDIDSFRSYGDKINNIQVGEGTNPGFEYDYSLLVPNQGSNYNYLASAITKITQIPEGKLTSGTWAYMFAGMINLEEIPSNLDVSDVNNFTGVFTDCKKLKAVPDLSAANPSYVNAMFKNCESLTIIPQINTSKCTSFDSIFYGCKNITYIPFLDCGKATSVTQMFYMSSIPTHEVQVEGFKDLGKSYTQKSKNYYTYKLEIFRLNGLTHDSIMNIINNLYDLNLTYDVANGGTLYEQTLNLGGNNINKLTEDEIAIATSKGWIVS